MTSEVPRRPEAIAERLLRCGVAGAGGAGFPSYVKWSNLDTVDCLMVNLQEGEPVFYGDRWLVNDRLEFYCKGLEYLLENFFSTVVVATKKKYREEWISGLEARLDPGVLLPEDLPFESGDRDGLFLAYTGERYELSQEASLLWTVAGLQIGEELPTEHGWIVQNAESIHNIFQALFKNRPVVRKLVAVYGPQIPHCFLDLPVGTPFGEIMGKYDNELLPTDSKLVLMDGGPGWASEVEVSPENFGITKRTNGVMVADRDFMEKYRDPREPERINCMAAHDWGEEQHQKQPCKYEPENVLIPLVSNPGLEGVVYPGRPLVEKGQEVEAGDPVAAPSQDGISNYHHASVEGAVKEVTDRNVVITP